MTKLFKQKKNMKHEFWKINFIEAYQMWNTYKKKTQKEKS